MRKEIAFTEEEKSLLSGLLAARLATTLSSRLKKTWQSALESASAKIPGDGTIVLTDREVTICNSCLREAMNTDRAGLINRTLAGWLDVPIQQRALMERIDRYNDIILKCKSRREVITERSAFRYSQVFSAIKQMQQAIAIAVAGNSPGEFNKIAFISPGDEIAEFRLGYQYTHRDLKFYHYGVCLKHFISNRFTAVMDKPSVRQLLSMPTKTNCQADTLAFLQAVLY